VSACEAIEQQDSCTGGVVRFAEVALYDALLRLLLEPLI
jgi:hypothetical protein